MVVSLKRVSSFHFRISDTCSWRVLWKNTSRCWEGCWEGWCWEGCAAFAGIFQCAFQCLVPVQVAENQKEAYNENESSGIDSLSEDDTTDDEATFPRSKGSSLEWEVLLALQFVFKGFDMPWSSACVLCLNAVALVHVFLVRWSKLVAPARNELSPWVKLCRPREGIYLNLCLIAATTTKRCQNTKTQPTQRENMRYIFLTFLCAMSPRRKFMP